QKQANAEALDRQATMRLTLERMIAETDPVIPRQTPRGGLTAAKTRALEGNRQKKMELDQLSSEKNARHPQVETARLQLERLKKGIAPEDLALLEQPDKENESQAAALTMPNPAYQNLVAQLEQVKTEFQIRARERETIESDIAKYGQRVQRTP